MDIGGILDMWRGALVVAIAVSSPIILPALAIGLLTSLIQAATQMQENVMSFVPKIVVVGLVLALTGSWMLERLSRYMNDSVELTVEIAKTRGHR